MLFQKKPWYNRPIRGTGGFTPLGAFQIGALTALGSLAITAVSELLSRRALRADARAVAAAAAARVEAEETSAYQA